MYLCTPDKVEELVIRLLWIGVVYLCNKDSSQHQYKFQRVSYLLQTLFLSSLQTSIVLSSSNQSPTKSVRISIQNSICFAAERRIIAMGHTVHHCIVIQLTLGEDYQVIANRVLIDRTAFEINQRKQPNHQKTANSTFLCL